MLITKLHIDLQVKAYMEYLKHWENEEFDLSQTFSDFIEVAIKNEWQFDSEGEWLSF
jgi:hypothetical protein